MRDPLLHTALIRPVHVLSHDVIKTCRQLCEVATKLSRSCETAWCSSQSVGSGLGGTDTVITTEQPPSPTVIVRELGEPHSELGPRFGEDGMVDGTSGCRNGYAAQMSTRR